ncbi:MULTISPECIES: hypothetical protein [unclassified Paenibacillus]|uniref:hypothetical protein n=1 Tax=unclassified Paenibacillus TaxID=185978 RepID=UPI0008391414|nr:MULTISPECIES: hypothetical protein [unclassified Paenibacillus]NWL86267.1 hypothetical protein [Paenibacillus sp. 79R4]
MLNPLRTGITVLVFVILIAAGITTLSPPGQASAAAFEFTDSINAQLGATADKAGKNGAKLRKQYTDFKSSRTQIASLDDRTSALHYDNESKATAVRKAISNIDSSKISKLEEQVKTTKSKYQPLYTSYTSLNKQVAAANKLKDKSLYKVLKAQAEGMKLVVDITKQDLKSKEAALKTAKAERTKKQKQIRSILSEIDAVKTKIKAEKSAVSTPNKQLTTEWSNFKAAVKKNDADRTMDILARLLTLSAQINTKKQNIYNHESKISSIIQRANSMLP